MVKIGIGILRLLFLGIILLMLSCKDNEKVNPDSAELEIKVKDKTGDNIAGAKIKLYDNQSDLNSGSNPIDSKSSDLSGEVIFKKLSEKNYYYSGQKNQLYGEGSSGTLTKGERKKKTLTLE